MKIAVFADVHGNKYALEAVLADIKKENPDHVVCAGDMVNPYSGSQYVWQRLKNLKIPMVRGNHEDYVLACYTPSAYTHITDVDIRQSIQFMPVQQTAKQLSRQTLLEIKNLPLSLTIPGPNGDDVFICHASPNNNNRSFGMVIDEAMAIDLQQVSASTIVAGHLHKQWQKQWYNKHLILMGSVGLPFNNLAAAEYVILTYRQRKWHVKYKLVPYNRHLTLKALIANGFLEKSGPIGLLLFDELLTKEHRIVPFLSNFCPTPKPNTMTDWQVAVQHYLEVIGRWQGLVAYIQETKGQMPKWIKKVWHLNLAFENHAKGSLNAKFLS